LKNVKNIEKKKQVHRELYRKKVKEATKNHIPRYIYNDSCKQLRRRIYYVRYADDFLIGIHGTKEFAKKIQFKTEQYLKENLHLNIKRKQEKTIEQVLHSRTNAVRFLGFDLKTPSRDARSIVNTRKILSFKKLRNRIVNKKLIMEQKYTTMLKNMYLEAKTRQLNQLLSKFANKLDIKKVCKKLSKIELLTKLKLEIEKQINTCPLTIVNSEKSTNFTFQE